MINDHKSKCISRKNRIRRRKIGRSNPKSNPIQNGKPLFRESEERKAGVLVHHVASSYPAEIDLAYTLASGEPITGVTYDDIESISNADHARGICRGQQTRRPAYSLRTNSKAAADRVRKLLILQLDQAGKGIP